MSRASACGTGVDHDEEDQDLSGDHRYGFGRVRDASGIIRRDEIPEGAVSVEAVLACDEFTGEVLAYAQEHGYCPTPGKGGVTPQAVQTYNCGSAWIYGFNNGIRGRMYVSYGFSSTQGVVVYRNLTVGTDLAIGWGDGAAMWSTSYDSGSRYVGIGSLGWHSASYSGAVTLVWGGWCTIPTITDNFTI